MTDMLESQFRPLSVLALLRGAKVYEFDEFYRIKNALIRYDHRNGYLNYGLWDDGDRTVNPSAALVSHVAAKLQLGPTDVLLNVGSGMGQPDIDIAQAFNVKRIIGINCNAAQVSCANRMFAGQRLDDVIHHRVCDALEMETNSAASAFRPRSWLRRSPRCRLLSGFSPRCTPSFPWEGEFASAIS